MGRLMLVVVLVVGVLAFRNLGGDPAEVVRGVRSDVSGIVAQSRAVKDTFDEARATINELERAGREGKEGVQRAREAQQALERARAQSARAIGRAEAQGASPAEIRRLKADARTRISALRAELERALR